MRATRTLILCLALAACGAAPRPSVQGPVTMGNQPGTWEHLERQAALCGPPPRVDHDYPRPGTGGQPATLRAYQPHPYRITNGADEQVDVREAVVSEDGCLIAIHRTDRHLDVWSNREERRLLSRPDTDWGYDRTGMAFSADGSLLAVAGQGGVARVYDVRDGRMVAQLDGNVYMDTVFRNESRRMDRDPRTLMQSVSFSPDGRELVTTGNFGTVILWELATRRARWARRMEPEFQGPSLPGGHAVFIHGGRQVVVMGQQRVQLLSAATGEFVQPFPVPAGITPLRVAEGPLALTVSRPEEMVPSVDWRGLAVLGHTGRLADDTGRFRWIYISDREHFVWMHGFIVPDNFSRIAIRPEGGWLAGMDGDTVRVYSVSGTPDFVIPPSVPAGVTGRTMHVLFGVRGRMYTVHHGPIPLLIWDLSPI